MSDVTERPADPGGMDLFVRANTGRDRLAMLEPVLQRLNARFGRSLRAALLQRVRPAITIIPAGIHLGDHYHLRRSTTWCDRVGQASVTCNAGFGKIGRRVGDLAALRPNNAVEMDRPDSGVIQSGDVPLFRGQHGGKIGVFVKERLALATRHSAKPVTKDGGTADGR